MKIDINNFIIESLKPFKFLIIGLFIIAVVWSIDLSLRPYLLKIIIDKISIISKDNAVQELIAPIIFYLAISLLIVIVFRIYDYIWIKLNPFVKKTPW